MRNASANVNQIIPDLECGRGSGSGRTTGGVGGGGGELGGVAAGPDEPEAGVCGGGGAGDAAWWPPSPRPIRSLCCSASGQYGIMSSTAATNAASARCTCASVIG